jgi:hypothetical protein
MGDISKGEGRTVLFVSHNMAAVQSLCSHGLVIDKGNIVFDGNVTDSINKYLDLGNKVESSDANISFGSDEFSIVAALYDKNLDLKNSFRSGEAVIVDLNVSAQKEIDFKNYVFE